jgi:hypothetical protein
MRCKHEIIVYEFAVARHEPVETGMEIMAQEFASVGPAGRPAADRVGAGTFPRAQPQRGDRRRPLRVGPEDSESTGSR